MCDDRVRRRHTAPEGERPQATELELDEIKQRVRRRAANPSRRKPVHEVTTCHPRHARHRDAVQHRRGGPCDLRRHVARQRRGRPVRDAHAHADAPAMHADADGDNTGGGVHRRRGWRRLRQRAASSRPRRATPPSQQRRAARRRSRPTEERRRLPGRGDHRGQPTRQAAAAAQTSQLPFTGFAAIPVLLGGLALLTGGLVLRRRTRSEYPFASGGSPAASVEEDRGPHGDLSPAGLGPCGVQLADEAASALVERVQPQRLRA